jgi:D-3-phosphoglycerate dehydrogenase
VGVVGVGVIGARLAEILTALGARVLRCDPRLEDGVSLATVLAESDVVTLHCELTAANRGLIGSGEILAMRPGAVLVNTARGPLLDVEAALSALDDGHLAGLGLDVFPREPTDLSRYVGPRVVVTPHAAGWHPALGAMIAEGIVTAVRALINRTEVPFRVGEMR